MKLSNLPIGAKLGATFAALTVIVLAVSGLSLLSLGAADARFEHFVTGINARSDMAAQLRTAVDVRAISARNLVLVTAPDDAASEKVLVTRAHADVQARLEALVQMARASDVSPKARELIAQIQKVEQAYGPVALSIVQLALGNQKDKEMAITAMNEKCRPLLAALTKATDDYASYSAQTARNLSRNPTPCINGTGPTWSPPACWPLRWRWAPLSWSPGPSPIRSAVPSSSPNKWPLAI